MNQQKLAIIGLYTIPYVCDNISPVTIFLHCVLSSAVSYEGGWVCQNTNVVRSYLLVRR